MTAASRSRRLLLFSLLAAATFCAIAASAARAADTVYWGNYGSESIGYANLAGGGAGLLDTGPTAAKEANGITLDPAAGRIYWISTEGGLYYANLSGGGAHELSTKGAAVEFPIGLAIDTAVGKVFWANYESDTISYANLDGSGGGDLNTSGATISGPSGVAIDPSTGRIYWANEALEQGISYANINGGGGGDLNTSGATVDTPNSPVIDAATGRVYWANYENSSISYANLNGSGGGGDLQVSGATLEDPFGLSIDPTGNRIYWANELAGSIASADLSTGQGAILDTGGATLSRPDYPTILTAPAAASAPSETGGPKIGSTFTCTPGTWSGDVIESAFFRAPQSTSLQWLDNGQPVAGATATAFKPTSVGTYSCQSSATNQAGTTTQASAPISVFSIGKAKPNRKKGTALLPVTVPAAGTLVLSGKQLAKQKKAAKGASTIKLLVKAKGKASKSLTKKGKAKLKASIAFTPATGTSGSQPATVALHKSKPKPKKR